MLKKSLLVVLFIFFISHISAQTLDELSKALLQKQEISEENFQQSIAAIEFEDQPSNDTILKYNEWLTDNISLLSTRSTFFKVHYFVELALSNTALNNNSFAYQNIDSALSYINHLKYPDSYYNILWLGQTISHSNLDGTTTIRYLKQIIESKIIDHDPVTKGETLIRLSGILENMHKYMESSRYCSQSLEIYQELEDDAKMIKLLKIMYNNVYHTTEDESNWEYLYQANEIAQRSGDSALLADVYSSFGLAHYRNGDQLEAVRYYKMARSLISAKGSYNELWAATYQHLSYTILDSVESACNLSKYLLEQCLKNNSGIISNAYRGRAWCFAKTGLKDSAAYYLEKSAQERESGEKADASPGYYYYMYEIAMLIDNYELALKYLETSLWQFRKYNRESAANKLNSIRAEFDYDLQKERIKKLKLQNELEHTRIQRQRVINVFIIVLLIIALFFLYYRRKQMRNLNAAYKNLVKKNMELDKVNVSLKKLEKKKTKMSNGLNIKDEEKIYLKLKDLLEEEKIFRRQDMSETKLAELLETNNSYLSSIINNRFQAPFKTLLNKYRIDEARRLLVSKEYANYSIEGIANEVGYQSRSAFYQVFKQNTGMTPSVYVKTYKQIED